MDIFCCKNTWEPLYDRRVTLLVLCVSELCWLGKSQEKPPAHRGHLPSCWGWSRAKSAAFWPQNMWVTKHGNSQLCKANETTFSYNCGFPFFAGYPLLMPCCKLHSGVSRDGKIFFYACELNPTWSGSLTGHFKVLLERQQSYQYLSASFC